MTERQFIIQYILARASKVSTAADMAAVAKRARNVWKIVLECDDTENEKEKENA